MFFANSLGPEKERPTALGLYHHVAAKFPGRDGVPSHELFAALDALIREKSLPLTAPAAMEMLSQAGLLRFEAETDTAFFTG